MHSLYTVLRKLVDLRKRGSVFQNKTTLNVIWNLFTGQSQISLNVHFACLMKQVKEVIYDNKDIQTDVHVLSLVIHLIFLFSKIFISKCCFCIDPPSSFFFSFEQVYVYSCIPFNLTNDLFFKILLKLSLFYQVPLILNN